MTLKLKDIQKRKAEVKQGYRLPDGTLTPKGEEIYAKTKPKKRKPRAKKVEETTEETTEGE